MNQPPTTSPTAERNKALVRQMVEEMDATPGADVTAKWMWPDYRLTMNGLAMTLDDYRGMVREVAGAFSNLKHEIHHLVAEGDQVVVGATFRATHIGVYEGIAATGRTIAIEEIVILEMRDGKVASEWAVVDLAALHQQLTSA